MLNRGNNKRMYVKAKWSPQQDKKKHIPSLSLINYYFFRSLENANN